MKNNLSKNKIKLEKELNDLKIKYNKAYAESSIIDKKYNIESSKRWNTIEVLRNKIDSVEDKFFKLKSEELESKYSKEELENAKIILEDCGYTVVKI